MNAFEIKNTSFYRPHASEVYQRWAASVPVSFRFAVKIPKLISQERALTRAREPLRRFRGEIAGLGQALGPLLLQLPPSSDFEARRAGRFFSLLRTLHGGTVVCEPRHATWDTRPRRAGRPFRAPIGLRVWQDASRSAVERRQVAREGDRLLNLLMVASAIAAPTLAPKSVGAAEGEAAVMDRREDRRTARDREESRVTGGLRHRP